MNGRKRWVTAESGHVAFHPYPTFPPARKWLKFSRSF
jgi:hypothetical protein